MSQTDRDMVKLATLVSASGDAEAEAAFQRVNAELARLRAALEDAADSALAREEAREVGE